MFLKFSLYLLLVVAAYFGGANVNFASQKEIVIALITCTSILFATFGVYLGVVQPPSKPMGVGADLQKKMEIQKNNVIRQNVVINGFTWSIYALSILIMMLMFFCVTDENVFKHLSWVRRVSFFCILCCIKLVGTTLLVSYIPLNEMKSKNCQILKEIETLKTLGE